MWFLIRFGGKATVAARPIQTVREVVSFRPQQPRNQLQHLNTTAGCKTTTTNIYGGNVTYLYSVKKG
jgi:hypothetical protein